MRTYGIEIEFYLAKDIKGNYDDDYDEDCYDDEEDVDAYRYVRGEVGDDWEVGGDGSLCSYANHYGVEICTAKKETVHTLRQRVENLRQFFDSGDVQPECDCGIHIHVDYSDFKDEFIYKLYKKLNVNGRYSRNLQKLAGRWDAEYADINYDIDNFTRHQYIKDAMSDKFQLISQRHCYNTLEFRMFASTNDVDKILKFIDFVDACADYMEFGGRLDVDELADKILRGDYVSCDSSN